MGGQTFSVVPSRGVTGILIARAIGLVLAQSVFSQTTADDRSGSCSDAARQPSNPAGIPWSQIGAKVGANYPCNAVSVTATPNGARLQCAFQRLDGQATTDGLWLLSTVTTAANEPFRVNATSVGRREVLEGGSALSLSSGFEGVALPRTGAVSTDCQTVHFLRPGLTEEYTVSMDGIRQDFLVLWKPATSPSPIQGVRGMRGLSSLSHPSGEGQSEGESTLCVQLAVSGAKVEPLGNGAQLVLEKSGRKIAYNRLRVTDATGKELPARMEVQSSTVLHSDASHPSHLFHPSHAHHATAIQKLSALVVLVNDSEALYPIRIDPTFSDANWISMGGIPGARGQVHAAVVDGSGNLYVGGDFALVGDVLATNVAKWNGNSWSALGSGIRGIVYALAVTGSDVYAGGDFTTAGGSPANSIAKWDGTSWSALGSGLSGGFPARVSALAVSGSDMYAGGVFSMAGGSPANQIAKWNGSSWSALGSGMNGEVRALAASGSSLYAGGYFTTAGGSTANRIAKWDGISWSPVGSGMNDSVSALAVSGSDLYAGGRFGRATNSGGVAITVNRIAKWNGSSWFALGPGTGGSYVAALAVSGSDVYAVGDFTGSPGNYIAKWNGSNWSALGSGIGVGGSVAAYALAVSESDLYAGGDFATAGGIRAFSIAKWNGSTWSALSRGNDEHVLALALSPSGVYAGGLFTTVGGVSATNIAQWNGNSWSALGSGTVGDVGVLALASSGSDLYAGGAFIRMADVPNYIAKWNGNSWSALGSGMDSLVWSLAVSGSEIYAGGYFTRAGGVNIGYGISKWNGSGWSALGSGVNGAVYALAVSGSDLYAAGDFTRANNSGGTVTVNHIAKWNGSTWVALGSGLNGIVHALAAIGSDLYAGGRFEMATNSGGVTITVNYIAKWNGSTWSTLGSGMSGWVSALAVSGSDLYAGGSFTTAGGNQANYIAKWNGSSWNALGSGMNGAVTALAVSDSDLYAGGGFTTAGGKVSAYIARAYLDLPILSILRSSGDVTLSWPASFGRFVLQQNPDAANTNTWSNATYPLTTNGPTKSATGPITPVNQFFRLIGH